LLSEMTAFLGFYRDTLPSAILLPEAVSGDPCRVRQGSGFSRF